METTATHFAIKVNDVDGFIESPETPILLPTPISVLPNHHPSNVYPDLVAVGRVIESPKFKFVDEVLELPLFALNVTTSGVGAGASFVLTFSAGDYL